MTDHTVESLLTMGKLVATFEGKKPAEKILREVIKRSPWCIEAAQMLVEMGVPINEIWVQSPFGKQRVEVRPMSALNHMVS